MVSNAVANSSASAPLRVFTLGIGCSNANVVETCEGIARAGRGECTLITDAQNIMSEFGRLFYIGRSFVLRNIVVDWGLSTSANDHGKTMSRQVPRQIPDLYPDQQLVVLSLIRGPGFVIPRFIAISGQKDGAGDRIEFKVPVTEVQWPDQPEISPLHTAAARRMIANDLQDISDPVDRS